jgi:uncharacterized secreted protein with C-terminal beta-propeller domain
MPSRPLAAGAGVVAALVLTAGAITLLPGAAPEASAEALVPYDSCDALLEQYRAELEKTATPWGFGGGHGWRGGEFAFAESSRSAATLTGAAAGASLDQSAGAGATGTNLQERGVDEPDLAKTSGDLLLAVGQNRLQVLRRGAVPELLGSAPLGRESWNAELLVDGNRVLVIVGSYGWAHPAASRPAGWGGSSGATTAMLFDVSTPAEPRLLEELEIEGRYLSARLSDGAVRLVTSSAAAPESTQPAAPHGPEQQAAALEANRERARAATLDEVLPQAERRNGDDLVLGRGRAVECDAVRHAPSLRGASTLVVTTLDLGRGLEPRHSTGVTTDGDLVYASPDRLYVATSRWGTTAPPADDRPATSTATTQQEVSTELHAFDTTSPDRTSYAGSGSVSGYVLGRWALSSYDGHLRVATTSAPPWDGDTPSSSSVVVLEERENGLVQVGRVNDLGIGERIYAVRYFGDLATVVTFRQTDPLYVVDLSDPTAPAVLGELKIPGFSTYLHPVGDDLLLGVGQEADSSGRVTGMQVSLFDLRDLSAPTQVDRLPLGQGWSAAGDDSRAFGWVADRSTALLPFSVWDRDPTSAALGVRVEGRRLVEAGRVPVMAQTPAERVLHDDGHLYAVSRRGVVAGTLDGFERTGAVDFAR